MKNRYNSSEFDSFLKQFWIKHLYHSTDRANLESIIMNGGFYSWADCESKGIKIVNPGGGGMYSFSRENDLKHNGHYYVHLTFSTSNPMMFVAHQEGRIADPIILEISTDVISKVNTYYTDKNSVRSSAHIGRILDDFKRIHFSTVVRQNYSLIQ